MYLIQDIFDKCIKDPPEPFCLSLSETFHCDPVNLFAEDSYKDFPKVFTTDKEEGWEFCFRGDFGIMCISSLSRDSHSHTQFHTQYSLSDRLQCCTL